MEEMSSSQRRREFYKNFQTKILPIIKKYEKERKMKMFLALTISSLLSIYGLIVAYSAYKTHTEDSLGAVCVLFALAFGIWALIKKKFENSIKRKIMPTICSCFGDMKWSEGDYINEYFFLQSNVVPNYTYVDFDDVLTGSYKDVMIDIVESKFTVGSGKSEKTVFKGVVIKLDMNKEFNSHTVIKSKSLLHISPGKDLKQTTLEDVDFEKKYDVFTNNEVDARYLITPTFMERLKDMKVAFKADKVSCAFFEKHFIVALQTRKDLFSLCSLIKPIDDFKQYSTMYDEIESIIKLIDLFKLDQKIGL